MQPPSSVLSRLKEQAHARALHLHADTLGIEHLIETVLKDEDSAACQAVTFAFADPETLSEEVLALSDGLMVVGSKAVLPFSPRGVETLESARSNAASGGFSCVALHHVLFAAFGNLPVDVGSMLKEAGLSLGDVQPDEEDDSTPLPASGPLFRHFNNDARRGLSLACKTAAQQKEPAIAPAHLIMGALAAAPEKELMGLRHSAAREVLRGRFTDPSPPPDRELPFDPALERLLASLGPDADSLDLLAACHEHGSPELRAALERHKISSNLLARARSAWRDETPETES